jgi:hypothetical protein
MKACAETPPVSRAIAARTLRSRFWWPWSGATSPACRSGTGTSAVPVGKASEGFDRDLTGLLVILGHPVQGLGFYLPLEQPIG